MYEHKNKLVKGFTEKYNVTKLVYFEEFNEPKKQFALKRELRDGLEKENRINNE